MKSIIKELWNGNVMPPESGIQNTPEMKQLLEYISRHNDALQKTMTDEQKEIFEKVQDCWSEYASLSDESTVRICVQIRDANCYRNNA